MISKKTCSKCGHKLASLKREATKTLAGVPAVRSGKKGYKQKGLGTGQAHKSSM
jgi:hypothetical protein